MKAECFCAMAQIKLHLNLLLSRKVILIFIGFQVLLFLGITYASGIIQGTSGIDMMRDEYYVSYLSDTLLQIKFLCALSAVLMASEAASKEYSLYGWYILRKRRDKAFFWLYKSIAVWLIVSVFVSLSVLLLSCGAKIYFKENVSLEFIKESMLSLFVFSVYLSVISDLSMILFKHRLAIVFPLAFFWFMEENLYQITDSMASGLTEVFAYIFPFVMLKNGQIVLYPDVGGVLLIMFLISVSGCFLFYHNDL